MRHLTQKSVRIPCEGCSRGLPQHASLLGARPRLTLSTTGKQRSRSSCPPQRQALGDGFYSAGLGWRQHLRPPLSSPGLGPAVPSGGSAPLTAPFPPRPAPAANGRRAPAPLLLWLGGRRQPIRRRGDKFVAVATGAAGRAANGEEAGSRPAAAMAAGAARRAQGASASPGLAQAAGERRSREALLQGRGRVARDRALKWRHPAGLAGQGQHSPHGLRSPSLSAPRASPGSRKAPLFKETKV